MSIVTKRYLSSDARLTSKCERCIEAGLVGSLLRVVEFYTVTLNKFFFISVSYTCIFLHFKIQLRIPVWELHCLQTSLKMPNVFCV